MTSHSESKTTKGPFAEGMLKAAQMLNMTNSEILLMAGELSVGEMRTVRAVLGGVQAKIQQATEDDNGYGF